MTPRVDPHTSAKITPKPFLGGAVALVFDVDDKSLAFFTFDDEIDKLHVVRHGIMGKEMVFTKPNPDDEVSVYLDQAILAPLGDPYGPDFGGRSIVATAKTNLFDYGSQTARKTVRGLNVEYAASTDGSLTDSSETSFEISYASDQDATPHGYNTAVAHFTGMNITINTAFKCTFGVRGKYIQHAYFYEGPSGLTIYRECETVRLDGSSSSGEIEGLAQGEQS